MPKKRSGGGLTTTQQAAKFLGVAALSGAVLAGIALPAAGALGLAAKGTVEGFDEIPSNLKTPPLSQRTTIQDRDGGTIATVYSRDRTVVPLKDISPYMQAAIIAIEDSRFYEHGAVDLKGILRAMNRNVQAGGAAQGASTLTQQYVKNVFVEEAGDDPEKVAEATQQTLGRKVRELKYAIQVEEELGKKKILENYLNITFFGQQAYGVEAASKRYFSKLRPRTSSWRRRRCWPDWSSRRAATTRSTTSRKRPSAATSCWRGWPRSRTSRRPRPTRPWRRPSS